MTVRVALALAALAGASTFAQRAEPLAPPRQVEIVNLQRLQRVDVPEPPEPPAGENAWSLLIHTTGGFTGQGVGSVTISSDGGMACGSTPCATPIGSAQLDRFAGAVASAVAAAWGQQPLATLCSDCVRTTIVLKRRDRDVVRVYRASWDDTQAVMPELRELRRLALDLRAQRASR